MAHENNSLELRYDKTRNEKKIKIFNKFQTIFLHKTFLQLKPEVNKPRDDTDIQYNDENGHSISIL